jgi:hypothetical protein
MFRFIVRILTGLAVLGGSLILLFWVLGLIKAYAPAPVSTVAAKAGSLMQP